MAIPDIKELLHNYLEGKSTPEELIQLQLLLSQPEHKALADEVLKAAFDNPEYAEPFDYLPATMAAELTGKIRKKRNVVYVWSLSAAAAIALLIAVSWFYRLHPTGAVLPPVRMAAQFAPGGNKATLTLADGDILTLDSAANGLISNQHGIKVIKLDNGQLKYEPTSGTTAGTAYNKLNTPRGGQYQLTLPDGTVVWLNAASSIRYPVAFNGLKRTVEITGEAYFEVAKDPAKPFIVEVGNKSVEVLGTSFNIMAYNDEPVWQTTLVEGKVKVADPSSALILKPGQQAISNTTGFTLRDVDSRQATAWVHGKLSMKYVDVPAFMRQISRWYDIDVVFQGPVPEITFSGSISRTVNLSQVLEALNENGLHAVVENGKLIVGGK